MSPRQWPDPALDGTRWGRSPLINCYPHIRFFHCDREHPQTPTHVWWDGIAFRIDPDVFRSYRPIRIEISDHSEMRSPMGEIVVIWDDTTNLTLEQLEEAHRRAQEDAES